MAIFFLFFNKMAAILDLAIKYLTNSFVVVWMFILDLINLDMDTKTTILGQLVNFHGYFCNIPIKRWPSWIYPGWQPWMG